MDTLRLQGGFFGIPQSQRRDDSLDAEEHGVRPEVAKHRGRGARRFCGLKIKGRFGEKEVECLETYFKSVC